MKISYSNLEKNLEYIINSQEVVALRKLFTMANSTKQKGIWWLVFFASTAALGLAIFSHWEWLTLILPFVTTSLVKAMDIM